MHDGTTRPGELAYHGRSAMSRRLAELEALNADLAERLERIETAMRMSGAIFAAAGGA